MSWWLSQGPLWPRMIGDPTRKTLDPLPDGWSTGAVPSGVPNGALQVTWVVAHHYSNEEGGNTGPITLESGGGTIATQISGSSGRQRSALAWRIVDGTPMVFAKGSTDHLMSLLTMYFVPGCRYVTGETIFETGVTTINTSALSSASGAPTRWFKLVCSVTGNNPHTISGTGWESLIIQTGTQRQPRGWRRNHDNLSTSVSAETVTLASSTTAFTATFGVSRRPAA